MAKKNGEFVDVKEFTGSGDLVKVRVIEISGRRMLDIRKYYISADDSTPKPTQKGVALAPESFEMVMGVLKAHEEEIVGLLDVE